MGLANMAKIAGQRMSAETKATRAVVYARGGPVTEPDARHQAAESGQRHTVKTGQCRGL